MAELEKFYVGMIDFFSILLPGAVLAYTLRWLAQANDDWLLQLPAPASVAEGWSVFVVASYVLGHFLFLIGSLMLDKLYDRFKDSWFDATANPALSKLLAMKKQAFESRGLDDAAINAFQWSKCRLALEAPAALQQVNRFEADSKFFRSFTVVALILMAIFAANGLRVYALISLLFSALSFWRFCEQRFKSTRQAYWFLLTMSMTGSEAAIDE